MEIQPAHGSTGRLQSQKTIHVAMLNGRVNEQPIGPYTLGWTNRGPPEFCPASLVTAVGALEDPGGYIRWVNREFPSWPQDGRAQEQPAQVDHVPKGKLPSPFMGAFRRAPNARQGTTIEWSIRPPRRRCKPVCTTNPHWPRRELPLHATDPRRRKSQIVTDVFA